MSQPEIQSVEKPPLILRWLLDRKSRRITLAVVAGVILLGVGMWYWYDNQSVVDRKLVSEASFTVYAPRHAPDGYTVEAEQTNLRRGVLSYTFADNSGDKDITVTVQGKPNGFDMSQLVKGGSVNSTTVSSGVLYNLSIGGNTQYLVDTGDSLIYITSSGGVGHVAVVELANSLREQR